MPKFVKEIELLHILSRDRSWKHAESIAAELEVSPRTIMRYFNDLDESFGCQIVERSPEGFRIKAMDFIEALSNPDDFTSMAAIQSTPFGALLNSRVNFPPQVLEKLENLVEVRGNIEPDILKRLFKGIRKGLFLRVKYKPRNEMKQYKCVPLKFYLDYGLLYVVVYDEGHGHMITFAGTKIHGVEPCKETISPTTFNELHAYINSAWGKMIRHRERAITTVRFSIPETFIAFFRRNPLHETQTIEEAGARYIITLDVHSPIEFTRWALRFGADLRILAPDEVLDEMRNFLREMTELYGV